MVGEQGWIRLKLKGYRLVADRSIFCQAKVDTASVQDAFDLYLHGFVGFADRRARARRLMTKDGLNADNAAKVLGVSRRTVSRGLKAAREHDELAQAGEL